MALHCFLSLNINMMENGSTSHNKYELRDVTTLQEIYATYFSKLSTAGTLLVLVWSV